MSKVKDWLRCLISLPEYLKQLKGRDSELTKRLEGLEQQLKAQGELLKAQGELLEWARAQILASQGRLDQLETTGTEKVFGDIIKSDEMLESLKHQLSIHPVIWGEKEKLHISPSAAVFTCMFNTNSGSISIGDYSFAGSGVSILAGSHDVELTGFARRDAELKEGCDIHIGSGVWLASNCTVLGPCEIGDDAVIAAGAVVVPGTRVPAGAVYAGVPARQIRMLSRDESELRRHMKQAVKREQGVLFWQGWTEKVGSPYDGQKSVGHIMKEAEAVICTDRRKITLTYQQGQGEQRKLTILAGGKAYAFDLSEPEGTLFLELPEGQEDYLLILKTEKGLFLK